MPNELFKFISKKIIILHVKKKRMDTGCIKNVQWAVPHINTPKCVSELLDQILIL